MIYKTKNGKLSQRDIKLKELEAKLKRAGCDPVSIQIWIAMADAKKLGVEPTIRQTDKSGAVSERPTISIEVRQKAVTELMDRLYPKLKAIEHTGEVTAVNETRLTADEIKGILTQDPFLTAIEVKTNGSESSADNRTTQSRDPVIATNRNET